MGFRPTQSTRTLPATLGMADLEFYIDGLPQGTNAGGNFSQFFDISGFGNAIHRVELLARDTSGNVATLSANVVIAVP